MKHFTNARRLTALFLSLLMALGCLSVTAFAEDGEESITIGIYSTTDMHGKCYSLNPTNGKEVKDSYLKVATAMAEEREAMDGVAAVHTAMLGDKLLTDVLGAKRSGVLALMVEPLGGPAGAWNHVLHLLQRPFKWIAKRRCRKL